MIVEMVQTVAVHWRRIMLATIVVLAEVVFGVLASQGHGVSLIAVGVAALLLLLMCVRPESSTLIVLFGMYLNLPVLGVQFHDVPNTVATAFPVLLVVPLANYLLFRREPFVIDKVFLWMVVFLVAQLASTVFAYENGAALDQVLIYVTEGMMLYFLLINVIRTEAQVRRVIWTLLVAGAVMGGLTLYQEVNQTFDNNYAGLAQRGGSFETDAEAEEWRDRAAGPVGEINRYAQVLLVLVPLGLFRFWGERSRALRIGALMMTGLVVAGVILTFSRGAAVGLVLVLLTICYLWRVKVHHIALGLASLLLFISFVAPDYIGRLATIGSTQALVEEGSGPGPDNAIKGRVTENLAAWYMFLDHPLLGVGPENYRILYQEYAEPIGIRVHVGKERPAHNLYLSLAAELGVVGLGAFLAMVGAQIWQLLQIRFRYPDKKAEIVNVTTAALIALMAYLFAAIFLHMAFERYFYMLLVVCSAAANVGRMKMGEYQLQQQALPLGAVAS